MHIIEEVQGNPCILLTVHDYKTRMNWKGLTQIHGAHEHKVLTALAVNLAAAPSTQFFDNMPYPFLYTQASKCPK